MDPTAHPEPEPTTPAPRPKGHAVRRPRPAAEPGASSPSREAAEHLLEEQMLRAIGIYLRDGVVEPH